MEGQPTASQSNPQPSAVSMAASTASSTPSTSVSAQSAQSSAPGTATTAPRSAVSESLSPQPFSGTASEDGNAWILYFKRFAIFRRFTNDDIIRIFPLFLRGTAVDWYDQLSEGVRGNAEQLEQAFIAWFTPSAFTLWVKVSDMFSRMQRSDVTVDEYIVQLQKMAKTVDLQDENHIRYAFLKGLRPQKSQGHLTRILSYIDAMIPPWAVHDHRQIKRGLGSGIGSWISWTSPNKVTWTKSLRMYATLLIIWMQR